jgi:hypothetical protein
VTAPRGRPPVGPVIEVRLPADTLTALDAVAKRSGFTRAAVARDVLSEWAEHPATLAFVNAGPIHRTPCEVCGKPKWNVQPRCDAVGCGSVGE